MAALHNSSTVVLESQVDYLTVTTSSLHIGRRWEGHLNALQRAEGAAGYDKGYLNVGPYVGYRVGRYGIAVTGQKTLIQLSGEAASDQFSYFWKDHDTITRLDVAVTYRTPNDDREVAARAYVDVVAHRTANPRAAMPTLITNGDGGATLYIGKRTSSRFARIYNKQAECESRHDLAGAERYDRAWRLELELHDVDAQAVGMMLSEAGTPGPKIRYYIGHYLTQHGIECPYDMSQTAELPRGFRRRSDRDTRLDWLGKTVKPTIDWLKSSCGEDQLRDILGL